MSKGWSTDGRTWYCCTECGHETALPEPHETAPETVRYQCTTCATLREFTAGDPVRVGNAEYRCLTCDEHRMLDKATDPGIYERRVCHHCDQPRRHVRAHTAADTADILARDGPPVHDMSGEP